MSGGSARRSVVIGRYIREELSILNEILQNRSGSLPQRFQQPIARRNQAVLQRRQKPKAPQGPQRSSGASARRKKPKLSSKQRRLRAIGRAERAGKSEP